MNGVLDLVLGSHFLLCPGPVTVADPCWGLWLCCQDVVVLRGSLDVIAVGIRLVDVGCFPLLQVPWTLIGSLVQR